MKDNSESHVNMFSQDQTNFNNLNQPYQSSPVIYKNNRNDLNNSKSKNSSNSKNNKEKDNYANEDDEDDKSFKKKLALIIGLSIAIVVIIAIIVILVLKNKSDDDDNEKSEPIFTISKSYTTKGIFTVNVAISGELISYTVEIYIIKGWPLKLPDIPDMNIKETNITSNFTKEINLEEGKYSVTIKASTGTKIKEENFQMYMLNFEGEEIIFAVLPLTNPVSQFSLNIFNITKNLTIPVYAYLERNKAWNYENLPENMHLIPTFRDEDLSLQTIDVNYLFTTANSFIKVIIRDYKDIKKFHFYTGDSAFKVLFNFIYANNLEEGKYDVTLIHIGYLDSYFNEYFETENWEETYNNYKKDYNKKIEEYRTKEMEVDYSDTKDFSSLPYALVAVTEYDFVEWWQNDPSSYGLSDITNRTGFYEQMMLPLLNNGKILAKNLGNTFKSLNEEQKKIIFSIYHFSSNMFDAAEEQQKDIFVFLGKKGTEVNAEYYMKAIIKIYGDRFVYYYKGHPKDKSYLEYKRKAYAAIGVNWLDASIAAELIYFFTNGVEMKGGWKMYSYWGGFQSTTFVSIDEEYDIVMFESNYEESPTEFRDKLAMFMIYKEGNDTTYDKYLNGNEGILIEYNRDPPKDYNFSIYFPITDEIKHFNYTKDE